MNKLIKKLMERLSKLPLKPLLETSVKRPTSKSSEIKLEPIEKKPTEEQRILLKTPSKFRELVHYNDLSNSLVTHPTKRPDKQSEIAKLVVHTIDGVVTAKGLAKYAIGPNHISKTGCPTITYHYLIHQSGIIDKTCSHKNVTWHAGSHNQDSLAIAFNYKLDSEWEKAAQKNMKSIAEGFSPEGILPGIPPSGNQVSISAQESAVNLLVSLCFQYDLLPRDIHGHRELPGTGWTLEKGSKRLRKTCPGLSVNLKYLRIAVAHRGQRHLKHWNYYKGNVDGSWGPQTLKAIRELKSDLNMV